MEAIVSLVRTGNSESALKAIQEHLDSQGVSLESLPETISPDLLPYIYLAIVCQADRGVRLANRLILRGTDHTVPLLIQYQRWVTKLPVLKSKTIPFIPPPIIGTTENFRPLNPYICPYLDGYLVLVRTVNYRHEGYILQPPIGSSTYLTRNYLLFTDSELNLRGCTELVDRTGRPIVRHEIQGLEDCQLTVHQNRVYISGSTYHFGKTVQYGYGLLPSQLLDDLKNSCLQPAYAVSIFHSFDTPHTEKNWLPVIRVVGESSQLNWIYSCQPLKIVDPMLRTVIERPSRFKYGELRGSGGPINLDEGYLLIVHESFWARPQYRAYYHRFLWYDREWNLVRITDPWVFEGLGVEFCRSMRLAQEASLTSEGKPVPSNTVILGVGLKDRYAKAYWVDLDVIRKLLRPIGDFL